MNQRYDFEKMMRLAREPDRMTAVPWYAERTTVNGEWRAVSDAGHIMCEFSSPDEVTNRHMANFVADCVNVAADQAYREEHRESTESPLKGSDEGFGVSGRKATGELLEAYLGGLSGDPALGVVAKAALLLIAARLKSGEPI